ncbi:MAG: hypothetical protein JST91_03245 [Actinobacteria bacterium]|nr:hypothetical protein [Actinomycetota bacterium]
MAAHDPVEYVADLLGCGVAVSDGAPIVDLDDASDLLIQLIERRLTAVHTANNGLPLGLLLSGGIDSILVAACAARLGLRPTAVTVMAMKPGGGTPYQSGDERGAAAAAALGLAHSAVRLTPDDVLVSARDCIPRLGLTELWEVTSAIPVLAAIDRLDANGANGPALSGAGADALFLGGGVLTSDPQTDEAVEEYRDQVLHNVRRFFTRARLIPDYYERLLGSRWHRFVQVFQTISFWQYAQLIHPTLLWRAGPDGRTYDKYVLRYSAHRLGVSEKLAFTAKEPLQVSSGMVAALMYCARRELSGRAANRTYADPMVEPDEHTAVRWYLEQVSRERDNE